MTYLLFTGGIDVSRHTKYIQKMLKEFDTCDSYVESPDKLVMFRRIKNIYKINDKAKTVDTIEVLHYGTLILTIAYDSVLTHVINENLSYEIGEYAYSYTDCRIINQVLEKYVPGVVAHCIKGEIITD